MTLRVLLSGIGVMLVGPLVGSAAGYPTVGGGLSVFVGLFLVAAGGLDGTLPRRIK